MNNLAGFFLTFVAGASVGISMWPLKWVRALKWENFWLLYSIFSLIVVPFGLAFAVLPHLTAVYASLQPHQILQPFLMGLLWGVAQLGAGLCVHRLGLAVAGAVMNGTAGAFGTIIPLISLHSKSTLTATGLWILAGTALMLGGGAFCGWSGYLREVEARERDQSAGFGQERTAMRQASYAKSAYLWTLGLAVGSGILGSLLNIALAYGGGILKAARDQGAQSSWAPFAVWPIALLGGSVANIVYSIFLIQKNRTWGWFKNLSAKEILIPLLAACLWMAGIALYSSGTTFLGSLGVSIGYAAFMITMILSGQFAGLMTGEWQSMKPGTYRSFSLGVGLLVAAVLAIGTSKYLEGQ
jgi:L-rhamnose-H+ transport protein